MSVNKFLLALTVLLTCDFLISNEIVTIPKFNFPIQIETSTTTCYQD